MNVGEIIYRSNHDICASDATGASGVMFGFRPKWCRGFLIMDGANHRSTESRVQEHKIQRIRGFPYQGWHRTMHYACPFVIQTRICNAVEFNDAASRRHIVCSSLCPWPKAGFGGGVDGPWSVMVRPPREGRKVGKIRAGITAEVIAQWPDLNSLNELCACRYWVARH